MNSGESKYRQTPMDIFLERHCDLTSQGLDPDLAYLQCQEEKDSREFTLHLERHFCAQQAINFYGIDEEVKQKTGPSAYEKARSVVMKQHRDRLASMIRMKRDAGGDLAKVTREDLEGITDEELYEYIRLHPEDADAFDETVFFTDSIDEIEDDLDVEGLPSPTHEFANDQAVHSHFGIGDYWDPLRYADKDVRTVTNKDLENIQADTVKMIDHLSEFMGIDAHSETLYDSLTDAGRFEVLSAWTNAMPKSKEMLMERHYPSRMHQHIVEYSEDVIQKAQDSSPTQAQRRDPAFMDSHLKQPFTEYSDAVAKARTQRSKRVDPLKAASSSKSRSSQL